MRFDKNVIIKAKDVVKEGVVTIDGMATAQDAAALMRAEKTRYLLVQKRHADDAWGMVVIQDFIKGVLVAGRSPGEVNIYEIMTKPVITVPADIDRKRVV